jgi:DNA replication protein DnaC
LLCRSIVPELVNVVVPISWPDPNTTEHERANHPRFHCGNLQYERRLATDSNNKLINGNSAVEFIANDAPAIREYDKLARQCAAEGADYPRYLLRLAELELIERERRMVEGRIKAARFPAVKSLDSFDFAALPSLNKALVMELARSEYIERHQNIIAIGNSGTGKSHIALGLGLAACQKGLSVGFTTAAALVHELIEARDERRLLRLQRQLAGHKLLIVDELGYVPLSQTGAELLFEVFSQRYERGSTIVTSNLPFDEWTSVFGCERLTGALLDRLTHHVHILEMNGESYRLAQSKRQSRRQPETPLQTTTT